MAKKTIGGSIKRGALWGAGTNTVVSGAIGGGHIAGSAPFSGALVGGAVGGVYGSGRAVGHGLHKAFHTAKNHSGAHEF